MVPVVPSIYPLSHPHFPAHPLSAPCKHALSPSINPPIVSLHQWRPFLSSSIPMLYLRNPAPSSSPTEAKAASSSLIWLVLTVNLSRPDGGLESPVREPFVTSHPPPPGLFPPLSKLLSTLSMPVVQWVNQLLNLSQNLR